MQIRGILGSLNIVCNIAEKSDRWFSVSGRVKIDVGEKCFSAGKKERILKN